MSTIFDPPDAPTIDSRLAARDRASWGAIIAGAAVSIAVMVVLGLLGIGVGVFNLDVGSSPAIWAGVSALVAAFVGGIAAGRLCGATSAYTARWHGFVAWCATALLVVYLLTTAVGGVLGGAFSALGSTIGAVGRGVVQSADTNALPAQLRRMVNPSDLQSVQDDVLAYVRANLAGDEQQAGTARDRAVQSLVRATPLNADEAGTLLDGAADQAKQAAVAAKQKADAARKVAASTALYCFTALLAGALAAWLGGGLGAPNREEF